MSSDYDLAVMYISKIKIKMDEVRRLATLVNIRGGMNEGRAAVNEVVSKISQVWANIEEVKTSLKPPSKEDDLIPLIDEVIGKLKEELKDELLEKVGSRNTT